jgi:hypothetical protein
LSGAFGSKDEFQNLSNDVSSLESTRRALADRMDTVTGSKETELERLRTQVKTLQANPPAPPKKIVVDDTEPPKKPTKKKVPKPPTASQAQPPK